MHRSRFGMASWVCFGASLVWAGWMSILTVGDSSIFTYFNGVDTGGILPISGTLAILGIFCGIIGTFRSRWGQANCSAAIVANFIVLILLILFRWP